ncbi:MAG: ABC transporter permease [Anaerolineae bacterium]|nr:MAG: ABC transporter permease [Anaerolineae bacterium]
MVQSTQVQILRAGRSRRDIAVGILFLVIAAAILFMLPRGTAGQQSTFALTSRRGGVTIAAPDLVIPTSLSLYAFGGLAALAGGWQLARGFKRLNLVIALVAAAGVAAFLVWASRGKSINLTGMLVSSLVRATPIALAALSGIWSERSGVVNIGIEGMMLGGAFTSVVFASVSGSLFVGVVAGALTGVLLALLHALLSIRFKVDQIVSGTGIIILALGLTSYLQRAVLNIYPELNQPGPAISAASIPALWKIPVIGPLLFNQSPIIYTLFLLLAVTHVIMYSTRWGLRIRAVGEHPLAADTLGINVFRTRYISVLVSGAVAGLAGVYMSIGAAGRFNEGMTAGKGFLGLAAMIFGNWNPAGALLGSLIFGFFDSWQEKLAILQVGVAPDLLGMAPYLATMVVLAGIVGRARMPAADGQPYEKQ